MITDPARRGRALAELYLRLAPRLFDEILESLYACVRGLVAAGGFNRETAAAIDALHEGALDPGAGAIKALASERYAEYGAIGQEGGKAGAATVDRRLGDAAARHMVAGDPLPALIELVGALHEALTEGATEEVRRAE